MGWCLVCFVSFVELVVLDFILFGLAGYCRFRFLCCVVLAVVVCSYVPPVWVGFCGLVVVLLVSWVCVDIATVNSVGMSILICKQLLLILFGI